MKSDNKSNSGEEIVIRLVNKRIERKIEKKKRENRKSREK